MKINEIETKDTIQRTNKQFYGYDSVSKVFATIARKPKLNCQDLDKITRHGGMYLSFWYWENGNAGYL